MHQLKSRLTPKNLLDAFGILYTWHLQQDLMRSLRTVSLQSRLRDTQRVNTAIDDIQRLRRRIISERALRGRGHGPSNLIARSGESPNRSVTQFDLLVNRFLNFVSFRDIGWLENDFESTSHFCSTRCDLKARLAGRVLSC